MRSEYAIPPDPADLSESELDRALQELAQEEDAQENRADAKIGPLCDAS